VRWQTAFVNNTEEISNHYWWKGRGIELRLVEEAGVRIVEGQPNETFMSNVDDSNRVVEECSSSGVDAVLLYKDNLTDTFFDLRTGQAGAILQKLRNYRIRLAVVCRPDSLELTSRFREMLAEEEKGRYFGLFETRRSATEWLGRW
jgi:hypothetical protein